jgi:hypothetical protein
VSYGGTVPLRDLTGNEIEDFTEYPVENNLLAGGELTTGSFEESQVMDVSVYPNPTNGIINISADNLTSEDCEIALYSMTGSLVTKKQLSVSFGSLEETLDMSHLSNGTYIIKLVSEERTYQGKIIII